MDWGAGHYERTAGQLLPAARGLDATFVDGTAEALPLGDCEADVAVSVFGVIFAADPAAAARELARVVRPSGRVVLSLWIPEGPLVRAIGTAREAPAAATAAPAGGPPFPWHEPEALEGLLAPHGFAVELAEHAIAFTGDSVEAYVDAEFGSHPIWLDWRGVLEPRGELEAVRERMVALLDAANEDPAAFRVSSRYVVATAQRG